MYRAWSVTKLIQIKLRIGNFARHRGMDVARQQRRVGLGRASLCVRALGQNAAYLAQLA
jgi:hypothetical protein